MIMSPNLLKVYICLMLYCLAPVWVNLHIASWLKNWQMTVTLMQRLLTVFSLATWKWPYRSYSKYLKTSELLDILDTHPQAFVSGIYTSCKLWSNKNYSILQPVHIQWSMQLITRIGQICTWTHNQSFSCSIIGSAIAIVIITRGT